MITAIIILCALNIIEVACIAFLIVMLRVSYEEIKNTSELLPIQMQSDEED